MALMNHPFAAPSIALLALHPRGRSWGLGAFLAVLAPQIHRVGAALLDSQSEQVFAFASASRASEWEVWASSLTRPDVLLLLLVAHR